MSSNTHSDHLKRRAIRHASRGDLRKAVVALRERAALVDDGASWVMLGAMLKRAGRRDEAHAALRTGLFHHRRAGASGRARSVARLMEASEA